MGCSSSCCKEGQGEDGGGQGQPPPPEIDPISSKKIYSWDLRREAPPTANYLVEDRRDSILIKDDNRGGQLVVKNCVNFKLYVLSDLSSVTIDDCFGCLIVLGPVKGSVYMRDCKDMTIVVAASQLRFRDCGDIRIFSATDSDPVIENSQNIFTAPYYLNYNGIQDDFQRANLGRFSTSSNWYRIYDYTPPEDTSRGANWTIYTGEFLQAIHHPDPDHGINIKSNLLKEPFVPLTSPNVKAEGQASFSSASEMYAFLGEKGKDLAFCTERKDPVTGEYAISISYG